MIGTIEVTEANTSVTLQDDYDELASTMHEVRTKIQEARSFLLAAMIETPDPLKSSVFDLIRRADDRLFVALTAWEPVPEDVRLIGARLAAV